MMKLFKIVLCIWLIILVSGLCLGLIKIDVKVTVKHRFETPLQTGQEMIERVYLNYDKGQQEINAKLQREIDDLKPHVDEFRRMVKDLNGDGGG